MVNKSTRKKVEEELRKKKECIENIFESMLDGVCVNDINGTITQANNTLITMFGYNSPKEMIGKPIFEFVVKRESTTLVKRFMEVMKKKERVVKNFEITGLRKDGREFSAVVNIHNLWNKKGKFIASISVLRDFTEQKKAEEALKESEKKLNLAINGAELGFWNENLKTGKLELSQQWTKMFGYESNDIEPDIKFWEKLVHPDDLSKVLKLWYEYLKGKTPIFEAEHRLKTKSGEWRWVLIRGQVIERDKKGTPLKVTGIDIDITGRKKAEEALRENEEKFRSLFENANDAILIADTKTGKIIDANKRALKLFKRPLKEIIGMHQTKLHPPYKAKQYAAKFKKHVEIGNLVDFEAEIMTKDKKIVPVVISASVMKIKGRQVIQGIFKDITEIKKAKEKIKESEERWRSLASTAPAIILTLNREGIIQFLNRIVGKYTPEQAIGTSAYDYVSPDQRDLIKRSIKRVFQTGKPDTYEILGAGPKGLKTAWYETCVGPIMQDGKVCNVTLVCTDITRRKKAEIEKERLRKKIEKYTKKLELKVKKLEKDKIKLTNKEKLVLWGITRYPTDNDLKLAKKLKLKRSTVTAIRNRLRDENMCSVVNIPNLKALGAELLTIVFGRFNIPFKEKKEIKTVSGDTNLIYVSTTAKEFVSIINSKNMVEFEKKTNSERFTKEQNLFKNLQTIHFFYGLNKVFRFFDYSGLLKNLFEIRIQEETKKTTEAEGINVKLSKNEKKVLLKLIEYPELSASDLSFKVNLTRATVAKIKNKLLEQGLIKTLVIPNAKKLGLEIAMLTHTKHRSGFKRELIKRLKKNNTIFLVGGDKEAIGISFFKDYSEYKEFKQEMLFLYDRSIFSEYPVMFKLLLKNIKSLRFDFLEPTKELLEE